MAKKVTPESDLFRLKRLVGVAGFELATPCTPCKCATRLRYTPTDRELYRKARQQGKANGTIVESGASHPRMGMAGG